MDIGEFDRRINIQSKTTGQDATYGTETVSWSTLATVWAKVSDLVPSKSESVRQGLTMGRNQTRIRFRYRSDVDSSMRITFPDDAGRVLQIVGGPAEIGRRQYTEIVCEDYTS